MTILMSYKWDILKCNINGFSISKGVSEAKERKDEIALLETELKELDKAEIGSDESLFRKAHIQNRLHKYKYCQLSHGALIWAKVEAINEKESIYIVPATNAWCLLTGLRYHIYVGDITSRHFACYIGYIYWVKYMLLVLVHSCADI